MSRVARWCIAHRRSVVALWIVLAIGVLGISRSVGSRYSNNFTLGKTGSQRATDLLQRSFPAQSGDSDQIVLHARSGKVTDPAIRAAVLPMLAQVARLPHVTGVASPYASGGRTISSDGTIAFATVAFDQRANVVPHAAVSRVIEAAQRIASPQLQVELGGQAIEQAQRNPPGSTEAIGLAAAVVVLLVSFGSLLAMGLPVVTALLGLGTGVGLIGLGSRVLDMADFSLQLALMIGLGVGIDYALFILTRFRDAYRENGGDVSAAVELAMATAGRAVIFAGVTVVIALMGMFALGVSFLYGLAVSSSLAVLLVLGASLTLLPALLSFGGRRIGRVGRRARARADARSGPGFWERWIAIIQRRPWTAALAATALMLALASPVLGMRLGNSDAGNDRPATTTRKAYDLLAQGFGKGFNGPLVVVAQLPRPRDVATLETLYTALAGTPDVASVARPRVSPAGSTATIAVFPVSSPQSAATTKLVDTLRDRVLPPVVARTGATVFVGGATATQIDFASVLAGKLWLFIGLVVLLSALLLLGVFRSLLIPLQAAVMNLLSIGASLGVVVAVFQWGWLGGLFGVQPGPIQAFLPVMVFAIVFGLSMDYEVFLVSRIHEEWLHGGDSTRAVREGLVRTGRVITAAAAVMVVVFASFILGGDRVIELFGLGLAGAVFLDAVVIRCILLPAVLEILGDATWRLPGWLERRLPRVSIERGEPGGVPRPALEEL